MSNPARTVARAPPAAPGAPAPAPRAAAGDARPRAPAPPAIPGCLPRARARRAAPAGSCRRPKRARRLAPAQGSAWAVAAGEGLRLRAPRDTEGEGARPVLGGAVHHDDVIARLRERQGEAGVAVPARVVVLEARADPRARHEQVRVERRGLEVHRDHLSRGPGDGPAL